MYTFTMIYKKNIPVDQTHRTIAEYKVRYVWIWIIYTLDIIQLNNWILNNITNSTILVNEGIIFKLVD